MAVTVQQAAANAFCAWLQSKLLDVVVEPQWPSPDVQKPDKSISIVTAGARQDLPIDLRIIKNTPDLTPGSKLTTSVWQVAACTQGFQLDIWATSDIDRDDIKARLDQLLHADASPLGLPFSNPVGGGCLIAVQDGWQDFGTIADFSFNEVDDDISSDTQPRDIYRATYSGDAYFMLAVTAVTARQTVITFTQRLSETNTPSDFT